MHRSEERELETCADCGARISPGTDRSFSFGSTGLLCMSCAIRRGGRYDEVHDHWAQEPDFGDLEAAFD
jgi:hypothetical protein